MYEPLDNTFFSSQHEFCKKNLIGFLLFLSIHAIELNGIIDRGAINHSGTWGVEPLKSFIEQGQ